MEKETLPSQLKYKPLPDEVEISCSPIEGMGIFAKQGIGQGTNLGMTHLKIGEQIIRTPLGGFLNHEDNANCTKVELRMFDEDNPTQPLNYKKWNLVTMRDIKKGEELTLKYSFYKI